MLSWQQIGSGQLLSGRRAVLRKEAVVRMPGSTAAVDLAMTKLILPEMKHLLGELRKG